YELGATPKEVRNTYFELAEQLDKEPVGAYDGDRFRWTTRSGLYFEAQYPYLAQFWQSLERSDAAGAETALKKAGLAPGERADAATQVPADNAMSLLMAVFCADVRWPTDVEHYQRAVAHDSKRFPLFGGMVGNIWPCAAWPYDPIEPPVRIDETAAQNGILIVQNLRDPA